MLSSQKHLFDLSEEITYLNTSYMSPLLKAAANAGTNAVNQKLRPYEITINDFFENTQGVKSEFAKIINAPSENSIAIIPSVSYGMAIVAKNIPIGKGQNIVIAGEQFPSNVYPWQEVAKENEATLRTIKAPSSYKKRGAVWNEEMLAAIDGQTALVAIGNVHWADGTVFDLKAIRKKTNEVGAWLAIDGTQSVGALPFDINEIQPEALICAAYKWLLGPYSMGLAYFNKKFEQGKPLEHGWIARKNSEDFSGLLNYEDEYQSGATRYDMGEKSSFIHMPILLTALKQLNQWGIENIQAYCKSITEKSIEKMRKGGLIIEEEFLAFHLFGVRLPMGKDLTNIKQQLLDNKIYVSIRGNSIRVSPHLFNSEQDLQLLTDILLR